MKKHVLPIIVVILLGLSFFGSADALHADDRPNVVLILGDDQGWRDYGFMGHTEIQTPYLDKLASQSLLFRRGYTVAPLCRPSLASILTGQYPQQHGVIGNDVSPARGQARHKENIPVYEQFHDQPNMVRMLADQGYLALQTGKYWEGSWKDGGFTHGMTHGDASKGGRHGDVGLDIGRKGIKPILNFIDGAIEEEKPFFIWYAPFLPHTPHNPPAGLLKKYQESGRSANVAKYYAMCEWFDQTCGQLMEYLEKRRLKEDTIVIFICDNGWAPVDRNADNPKGWWPDFSPRSKGSPFEQGIRTPIMVSWPGKLKPHDAPQLASSLDLFPTVLAACRIDVPPGLPGINLMDEQTRDRRKTIYGGSWSIHNMTPGKPDETLQYHWCISGDWKLLVRHHGVDTTRYKTVHAWDGVPVRLYDLKTDPDEKQNLAESDEARVESMRLMIEREFQG